MTQYVTDSLGTQHEFPDEATPEMIQRALNLSTGNIPLEKAIDSRSGAITSARRDVGGAMSPEDRLATLQRYYPDAQPYGEDNFVFTDPNTGRPTLYNPPGLDVGDVFSVTPEMFEFSGGAAAGAYATPKAVIQAPFTAGQSLWQIPAAVGLGAGAGREIENLMSTQLGNRVDTRGLGRRSTDAAVTIGVNTIGQRVGELIGKGLNSLVGPPLKRMFTKETPQGLKDAFDRQGIEALPGAVSGSRPVQTAEKALSYTPGGGAVMQQQTEKTIGQMQNAVRRTAQGILPPGRVPGGAQEIGGDLKATAKTLADKFVLRREALDDVIEQTIGHDTPSRIDNSIGLIRRLQSQLSIAPKTLAPKYAGTISDLNRLLADAGANLGTGNRGNVPFTVLRQMRTMVGQMLDAPDITGYSPVVKQTMRQLYGALAEDIKRAAQSAGTDAVRALERHDRYVRFNRREGGNLEFLQKLVDQRTDEAVFGWAMRGTQEGGSNLLKLRMQMPKETWDDFVSTVINRMGQAKPGQAGAPMELLGPNDTFSPNTFLTNFAKMSPEAKRALFGGTRYEGLRENLDDLVKIAASLKDAEKMGNPSGTGRTLLYGTLALMGGQMATGNFKAAVGTGASAIVAPYIAAKLITNPRFVRWLASNSRGVTSPHSLSNQLGRLLLIGKLEPAIHDEINQFAAAFRSEFGIANPQSWPAATRSAGAQPGIGPR